MSIQVEELEDGSSIFDERLEREDAEPVHAQVRSRLLGLIQSGVYFVGFKLPSEPDLAARFSVSRMTVNKAILGLVSDGWLVREKGKGTFVRQPKAVLEPCYIYTNATSDYSLTDFYFGGLYWPLRAALEANGYNAVLAGFPELSERASSSTPMVAINPPPEYLPQLYTAAATGSRVVLIGSSHELPGISYVDSDNILGGCLVANHLLDEGHRNVQAWCAYPSDTNTQDRIRGFEIGFLSRGFSLEPDAIRLVDHLPMNLELIEEFEAVIASPNRPTAIFAASARMCLQLSSVVQRAGLRVPDDISIVAYDDPDFLQFAIPSISTVRQPLAEMAREAARLICTPVLQPARLSLRPTFVLRDSTRVRQAIPYALQ